MQIEMKGADKRPANTEYTPLIAASLMTPRRSEGQLSRKHLRRLVAAMVD
ncbi:hypothetical protein I5E68_12845 [Novosphingobium sp. YJ-S2-02]|uniref:Uncharacterized protein n=1 Tax=Novosphingobium aureum TaxID=2792964 RepID=A0A931HEA9_9SPHN|nr:hypothetical protein [Novosphingobium aureum]